MELIIISILSIAFLTILIVYLKERKNFKYQKQNHFNLLKQEYQEKIEIELKELIRQENHEKELIRRIRNERQELEAHLEETWRNREKIIDLEVENYREREFQKAKENTEIKVAAITTDFLEKQQFYNDTLELSRAEVEAIKSELDDYRHRREAINLEIKRENDKKLQQEKYQIILTEEEHDDIDLLLEFSKQLKKKTSIYKLIWSEYLQAAFQRLIKNQFIIPPKNVIYCIENIKTSQKYIGKTAQDVSKRWTDHIKTSLSISGTQSALIHKAMFRNWEDFSFSVLEETTAENLSEREKYYIKFFESDKFGYNMKIG